MKKKKKILVTSIGLVILIGIASYASMNLFEKMDQVKELNGQIAEAEDNPSKERDPDPSKEPDSNGDNDPEQVPGSIDQPSKEPSTDLGNIPTETPSTSKPVPSPDSSSGSGNTPVATPSPEDKTKKKKEIDAATTESMEKLRASCKATSNKLVNQIVAQLKAEEDASLESIQGDFLTDIIAAEGKCDIQFNLLFEQSKTQYRDAGLDEQSMPDWSGQYESAKSSVRADALNAIRNAL